MKKLGYTEEEFLELMRREKKSFLNYRTSYGLIKKAKPLIQILTRMGIVPETVYNKYFLLDESADRRRS